MTNVGDLEVWTRPDFPLSRATNAEFVMEVPFLPKCSYRSLYGVLFLLRMVSRSREAGRIKSRLRHKQEALRLLVARLGRCLTHTLIGRSAPALPERSPSSYPRWRLGIIRGQTFLLLGLDLGVEASRWAGVLHLAVKAAAAVIAPESCQDQKLGEDASSGPFFVPSLLPCRPPPL